MRSLAVFSALFLVGCTPKYDWRLVSGDSAGWIAMFPGKPVEVTRTFSAPGVDQPVSLTLRSARVEEALFAVGWVTLAGTAPQTQAPKAAAAGVTNLVNAEVAEKIRAALEAAMLANIQHTPSTVERQLVKVGALSGQALTARGRIPAGSKNELTAARLWMRSLIIPSPAGVTPPFFSVVEIIAVGPDQALPQEIATQFVESLELR